MSGDVLKDLARTCWIQIEDLSPYKRLDSADQARQTKAAHYASVYLLLKGQFTRCYDCAAVLAWMQLRGWGMAPGETASLFATVHGCCENGSPIGQFVLGYMYGFLGPIFWEECSCELGEVGRNKSEAIRLFMLAQQSEFMRPTASFFLGLVHELDSNISAAKAAFEHCLEHPLALWSLSNCQTDVRRATALKAEANQLGYQRVKDVYFYFHGRGTGCDLSHCQFCYFLLTLVIVVRQRRCSLE